MPTYAKETRVSVDKSKAEIQRTLTRWGASAFMYAEGGDDVMIAFKYQGLTARFTLPMPDRNDPAIVFTAVNHDKRTNEAQEKVYQQFVRQRWRGLLLILKAKLEAIELGIMRFDQEFLPYFVLPSGVTVTDQLMPQIYQPLDGGSEFPMLPHGR